VAEALLAPRPGRGVALLADAAGPLLAALLVALRTGPGAGLVALLALVIVARWGHAERGAIALLPLARVAVPVLGVLGAVAVVALAGLTGIVAAASLPVLAGAAGIAFALRTAAHELRRARPGRVLVLGTARESAELAATLADAGSGRWRIVAQTNSLLDLGAALDDAQPDLVVHTDHLPRAAVRGALAAELRTRDLQALHRDRFCELAFGVVPLASVDEEWLLDLADPRLRATGEGASRALDIAVSAVLLVAVLPLLLLIAPFIALDRDGGVLFRQRRVGRHGQAFTILKLRTMRGTGSDWSGPNDPRVTRLGAILRKTHVDELPQLWNVLRGDMALVGPRPEQVTISAQLEGDLPLFPYRHLVRPGITGWGRVRAGYAATTEASAIKLGNDLFYLRHRSSALDVAILVETVRVSLFERQYDVQPPAADIVLGRPAAIDPLRRRAAAPVAAGTLTGAVRTARG
jgi:lipopolysaccharide/colanic/teichoic acid biosynthesis glycosyltransferase